jgi:hypothetical protein
MMSRLANLRPFTPAAFLCGGVGLGIVLAVVALPLAHASQRGKVGYSGNPATNDGEDCTTCHGGGFEPVVTLEGPSVVPPGAQRTFTMTVAQGQYLAAGFDVSVTAGFLQSLGPDTRVLEGEVTHVNPKIVDPDTGASAFTFSWTAPMAEGSEVTFYGVGNSVNGDTRPDGDGVSTLVKQVLVSRGAPPISPPEPTSTATATPTATAAPSATAVATSGATATVPPEPTETARWSVVMPVLMRGALLR